MLWFCICLLYFVFLLDAYWRRSAFDAHRRLGKATCGQLKGKLILLYSSSRSNESAIHSFIVHFRKIENDGRNIKKKVECNQRGEELSGSVGQSNTRNTLIAYIPTFALHIISHISQRKLYRKWYRKIKKYCKVRTRSRYSLYIGTTNCVSLLTWCYSCFLFHDRMK